MPSFTWVYRCPQKNRRSIAVLDLLIANLLIRNDNIEKPFNPLGIFVNPTTEESNSIIGLVPK